MTRLLSLSVVIASALLVSAHGDHSFDLDDLDTGLSYAERHMHTEHHIDSFDLESFFKLHDLDMDGQWDEAEIQAVYGLHHDKVKETIQHPDLIDGRAKVVVDKVLQKLDTNGDGKISLAEFMAGGTEGLPSFEGYKDLGHHYDEESEYFLHHEELYHSTPETQTDESYTHPEDIEHFRHHIHIEDEEDARERKFEGLADNADLSKDHVASDPLDEHAHAPGEGPSGTAAAADAATEPEATLKAGDEVEAIPPRQRVDPNAAPQRIMSSSEMEGGRKAEWESAKELAKGNQYEGHGRPRSPEERLRAGVPYKYKMRKGLRGDEF